MHWLRGAPSQVMLESEECGALNRKYYTANVELPFVAEAMKKPYQIAFGGYLYNHIIENFPFKGAKRP